MTKARLTRSPDWRQFLRFGEQLLNEESVSAQCERIRLAIEGLTAGQVVVWLAEPFYPLPGEPAIATLPTAPAPEIVQACYEKCTTSTQTDGSGPSREFLTQTGEYAFPLVNQKNTLGVIWLKLAGDSPLDPVQIETIQGLASHAALSMEVFRQAALKLWRFDQLALVRSVSSRMANMHDLEDFYQQVAILIQKTFNFYYVAIFTLDKTGDELNFQASASSGKKKLHLPPGFSVHLDEGIVGTVAQTGQEIISPDVGKDTTFRAIETLPDTKSEVALPLKTREKVLGVLDIQSKEVRSIHEFDVLVLRALADNIAKAIEGMELIQGLSQRANQIAALLEISHTLTSILEFDPLLDEVVQSIQKHFGYPYVHIFVVHSGRRKIFYEAGTGARSQAAQKLHLTYGLDDPLGMIPWAARNGQTLLANDVSQQPLYRPSDLPPSNTCSELAIPLSFAGHVLGVLDIQSDQVGTFSESDVSLLESLGASIAVALRNARLYSSEVWRRKVADSFREIAGLVSANIALGDLLDRILSELEQILPCDASAIWLLEESSEGGEDDLPQLKLAADHNVDTSKVHEVVAVREDSLAFLESVLDHDEPVIRAPHDPYGPLGLALGFSQDYSSIAAPLKAGEKPLGVLALAHNSSGQYGSESGLITMTFANHAAVAIQNNQLFASAQEQAWISTILLQIAEAVQGNLSIEELLETMVRLTPLLVGVMSCAFFIYDEASRCFEMKTSYGLGLPAGESLILDSHLPIIADLIEKKNPVFVYNPQKELDAAEANFSDGDSTLVIVPMLARGRLLGAYLVGHEADADSPGNSTFDPQTLSLLQGIAQQTAVALENLELIEARQEEAYVTAVLLQVAQAVVSQNDLEDILDTIVHLMPILVGIDSCAIYLWDENQQAFRTSKVFTGSSSEESILEGETFRKGDFPLLDALLEREQLVACKISDGDLDIDDWRDLDCVISGDELEEMYTPDSAWILAVPFSVKGRVYGALLSREADVPTASHQRRLEILAGIAQQVSLAIQNDRLNKEMVERERLEGEIQLARQIQKTFLPSRLPRIDQWELEIHWQTAREVGGDFYDVFKVARNRLGVVIADVSDKGMPAALYMTVTRTLIRAFSQKAGSPSRVLARVNRSLVVDSQDGLFVTAVFGILDTETGQFTYANAGHNLPILISSAARQAQKLSKGGTALGISAGSRFEDHVVDIHVGDSLVFYTDGVTESFSPEGEIFGEERLVATLESAPSGSAGLLIDYLRHELNDFRHGAPPSDDMTIVMLHHRETAGSPEPD